LRRFAYDASGRLEQQASHLPAGMPLAPGGAGGSASASTEHGPVFDPAGRVIGDGRFRYEYTARGQVASVMDLRSHRRIASYAYNHRGQRVRKIVHAAGEEAASTRYFLWDEQRLAAEIAPDGRIIAQYLALDDGRRSLPIARLENRGMRRVHDGGDVPGDDASDGSLLAIHADHRGAPVALTDARGRLAWQAEVAPSGRAVPVTVAGGVEMNLRLPGQYFDRETGLHDNWHRSYDPERGRFLQPDPLGYPDGPDAYAYAGGDPVNRLDPLGLYEIDVHYYMTFFLAVTAGLAPEEARIVALAAQYVDHNPLTRPVDSGHLGSTVASVLHNQARLLNYHFVLSGPDGRTLPQYRNARLDVGDSPQLANLLDAVHAAGISRNASLQFLGEYLHALADTYSHRNARNIPYDAVVLGCGVGHGLDMHEPDLTYDAIPPRTAVGIGVPIGRTAWFREARTLAMELELHGVLLAIGDPSRAREASEIEATLRDFNAIRESESRGVDFAQKIALLQSRLAALGYGHIDLRNDELFGYNEREARTNRVAFLRNPDTGAPLREEDFPGVCLEGGMRCRPR
jgi:RHS repeat-associated protein